MSAPTIILYCTVLLVRTVLWINMYLSVCSILYSTVISASIHPFLFISFHLTLFFCILHHCNLECYWYIYYIMSANVVNRQIVSFISTIATRVPPR
jgi:hypothetical protein